MQQCEEDPRVLRTSDGILAVIICVHHVDDILAAGESDVDNFLSTRFKTKNGDYTGGMCVCWSHI